METKEWTLMFYFASDNPLASTIVSQLKAIKDAGYHPDANVLAHFDPHTVNTPVHTFDVHHINKFRHPNESEVGLTNNDAFVTDLVLDRLWGDKEEDIRNRVIDHVKAKRRGDFDPPKPTAAMIGEQDPKESLQSFLNFCRESYPARHYMLFILGHGQVVGNDTLLYDDHGGNTGRNSLSLIELGEVLRAFRCDVCNDREPGQVEMVTLHSCSMSALEVAYELRGSANYMMASQGPTYVGNLPYRQILVHIFNDLNSKLTENDINGNHDGKGGKQILVERLAEAAHPVAKFLRDRLTPGTELELASYVPGNVPNSKLVSAIVKDFNRIMERDDTDEEIKKRISSNGSVNGLHISGAENRRRYNRHLLANIFPEIAKFPSHSIEETLEMIFYFCIYNSYDFQLAGYPFDLCLTDLTKVSATADPINKLAESLIEGLKNRDKATATTAKQLILLAHLDAQSFYREDYVDLYDFCFCLTRRCKERQRNVATADTALGDIFRACDQMMNELESGNGKLIRLAEFSGAAFQYSHGHSIFFPWVKPESSRLWDEHYSEYRLSRQTKWRDFLNVYFETTMRKTRAVELKEEGRTKPALEAPGITAEILALISQIGAHVFVGDGQLQKPGPDSPMGKSGPDSPMDSSCTCPTIKNYPSYIGLVGPTGQKVRSHQSEGFFQGLPKTAGSSRE